MKKLFALFYIISLMLVLSFSVNAETKSGYTVDNSGSPTNIKYTLTDDGILTFEIDSAASGIKSTVLSGKDPVTLEKSNWNKALPTFAGATKVIIGEGITEICGTFAVSNVKTVEIPKSLNAITENAFILARSLNCVYIKGNKAEVGTADLTNITKFGSDAFVGMESLKTIKLNPSLNGELPFEVFKRTGISTLEIPAGVEKLKNSSLAKNLYLKVLKILGTDTELESVDVFKECTTLPTIVAKKGSKAEAFAKANGLTFADIDTYKESEVTPSGGADSIPIGLDAFNKDECTAYGYITGAYYDTYWVYYKDTKTLKLFSNKSTGHNETGRIEFCEDGKGWSDYKNEIEHVEIGSYILKVTQRAFEGHTALKDVKLGKSISQVDVHAFRGCSALSTIWIDGGERIEGRADFSKLKSINYLVNDTAVKEVLISKNTSLSASLGNNIHTIFSPQITDAMISYAKEKKYDLKNSTNPSEVYNYYEEKKPGEEKPSGGGSGVTTPSAGVGLDAFDQNECTAYGYITGAYYDTYWVYYQETKTLKFFSNKISGHNETGRLEFCADGKGWEPYVNEIEHIEIGANITKITAKAFADHKVLKDIKLGKNITEISTHSFASCYSLTTIWRDGEERIEGRADFSKVKSITYLVDGTSISEILISPNTTLTAATPSFGPKLKLIISPKITDGLIEYGKENYYNIQSSVNADESYNFCPELPEGAVGCGIRSGYLFDEPTGTLTIYGVGTIDDITNYYGGGSKMSPWFSIKQKIKHVVITDGITAIGKYAFTQCQNLETVQIPDVEGFQILNSAFEKCTNLKSIYRAGTEFIEGTLDLRNIHELRAWTFAYDYLIANVILSDKITEMPATAFEENIGINLANIYGVPGSYAETYALENGKNFFDISSNVPQPITCEIPAETTLSDTSDKDDDTDTIEITVESGGEITTNPYFVFEIDGVLETTDMENYPGEVGEKIENKNSVLPVVIVAAVVVAATLSVVAVVIIKKKKEAKK